MAPPISSLCAMSPASADVSTRSCTSVSIRREPVAPSTASSSAGRSPRIENPGADRVVDVVVDVRDAVDDADDLPLERLGLVGPRVLEDPVAHLPGEVQPAAVALEPLDHAERVLVVPEAAAAALAQQLVERLLAGVAERRMPEVVAEADRLDEVLVEAQRPRDAARDARSSRACA